jgi:pyruvate, water dikinase
MKKLILWFSQISKKDTPLVGGKNASLGEMFSKLTEKGINIPNGFAITAEAFRYFLKFNKIDGKLKEIFEKFNPKSIQSLKETGKSARDLILKSKFPPDLEKEILENYQKLSKIYNQENVDVAVRSSATAEDLLTASFAGQHESYINISGPKNLLKAVKKCFASLFTDRAIAYREEKGFEHLKVALSVCVQKMVRSDLASSGVMFTLDTETGFENVVLINSIYGQGEMIVRGKIIPDTFYVFKPTLKEGYRAIIRKDLGKKDRKLVYKKGGGLKEIKVPKKDQLKFSLSDDEILTLAKWAMILEEHYGCHQDIEWAKDGKTGKLFIVQSRPETVHTKKERVYEEYEIKTTKKPILTGIAIGNKIGQGKVHIIEDVSKISEFKKGEVLVTKMTDPDWVSIFPLASAILTDEGGKTCFGGNTLLLTNKGFLKFSELYNEFKPNEFQTLSFDTKSNKIIWRPIKNVFKRKSCVWKITLSPNSKFAQNLLETTPDHSFLTLKNRKIIKKEISSIISDKEGVLIATKIPRFSNHNFDPRESYLMGALVTDGSLLKNKQGGYVVSFSQKNTPEKLNFINAINSFSEVLYNKKSRVVLRKDREKEIFLNFYSKDIYLRVNQFKENLLSNALSMDEENLLMFLAGVVDGDGNVSSHQIQITVGKEKILQAIIIASLRLGIVPSVYRDENWWVVSFDKKFAPELLKFTQRVNKNFSISRQGYTKKFVPLQVIGDIIDLINQRGRMKHDYLMRPNMITDYKIKKSVLPKVNAQLREEFEKILEAPFSMKRVKLFSKKKEIQEVYNLEVEADDELDHNYIVFTKNYTPVIVGNCHAAIVSRELGIPCIVGTGKATKILKNGQDITVDCTLGSEGRIFLGKIPFKVKRYDLKEIPKLPVKICLNIGAPDIAFKYSFLPVEGVGLARQEFIFAEKIRVHPLALYHFEKLKFQISKVKSSAQKLKLKKIVSEIEKITAGYKDKKQFFVDKLTEGIAQIGAAFWPHQVIVRFSDFKTNEYKALIGGELFEPEEQNPMLGWRGASRYYDEKFQPAFQLECKAIKKVREEFGLKNIATMIPFCRTPEEAKKVLDLMAKFGLERGKDGLKVYIMCEIPSNVILAKEFLELCDGFSIGSNDLTQCLLGLDRDNAKISFIANEFHPASKIAIKEVIDICNKMGKYSGICGDAPSTIEGFAEFLIDCKIQSISLSPDAVMKTLIRLREKFKEGEKFKK